MKANLSLSIPKPCSEDWNSFTPTSTGGFCGSCQKNVIDFTKATDNEIIAFISRKPEHTCGRFRSDQLKTYVILPEVKIRPGFTLLKAGAISLLLLFMCKQTSAQTAQTKPATEIVQQQKRIDKLTSASKTVVRGVVIDEEDQPVIAATVVQKGTTNGVMTDANGNYELTIKREEGRVLTISFIGMITKEVTLPDSAEVTLNISMVYSITGFLGEVMWTGETNAETLYAEQRSGLKKFWKKVKGLFK